MSDNQKTRTAGAPFSQTLEGKMANLEAANAALKKKIVERDTELATLGAELEHWKSEAHRISKGGLVVFDNLEIARQSRKRLVQLVRSFVEIRKTIGKVAKVIRERDQAQADAANKESTLEDIRRACRLANERTGLNAPTIDITVSFLVRELLNTRADARELALWLCDAALLVADWGNYASDYFKEKHGYKDDLKTLGAALSDHAQYLPQGEEGK